jgi:hypothetical protein
MHLSATVDCSDTIKAVIFGKRQESRIFNDITKIAYNNIKAERYEETIDGL